jgi:hypothetical protein
MIQSGKREQVLPGLALASAAMNAEPLDPGSVAIQGASGRLALNVWSMLAEGGSSKMLGRLLVMRRRNKDGVAEYGDKDPMDRPGEAAFRLPRLFLLMLTTIRYSASLPRSHLPSPLGTFFPLLLSSYPKESILQPQHGPAHHRLQNYYSSLEFNLAALSWRCSPYLPRPSGRTCDR